MDVRKHGISADLLIHPGETIADILEERKISQKELAYRTGVSEPFLSDVINGKKDISKTLAMDLEYALDIPASFWLNLQSKYDAELVSLKELESVNKEEINILKSLKDINKYLIQKQLISYNCSKEERVIELRKYLRISDLTNLKKLTQEGAFRISEHAKTDPYVLGAWLSMCKNVRNKEKVKEEFDLKKADDLIKELKEVMCANLNDPQIMLETVFGRCGIDFSILHHFPRAPVQGYIAKESDNIYQMVLTIRGAYADIFWFSLFHELGHIINGDFYRNDAFIDLDNSHKDEREIKADEFAKNALIDPEAYEEFISKGVFTLNSISAFAKTQNIPAYIVIGRLQKDKIIPWNKFTRYKPELLWK